MSIGLIASVFLATPAFAQKLDVSNESAYASSLSTLYSELPSEKKIQFEAFYYYLLGGGKSLPRPSKLKGLNEMAAMYPLVAPAEKKYGVSLNGLNADSIIAIGQKRLSADIEKKIEAATDEAIKARLKKQLTIIQGPKMTKDDLETYTGLQN